MSDLAICPCCGTPVRGLSAFALKGLSLTPSQRTVLNTLVGRFPSAIHVETIAAALWGDNPNGGPETAENVIRVYICALNKKLAKSGYRIECTGQKMRALRRVSPIVHSTYPIDRESYRERLKPAPHMAFRA